MTNLRGRLNLIMAITLICTTGLGWKAYLAHRASLTWVRMAEDSLDIRQAVLSVSENPFDESKVSPLQAIRRGITSPTRKAALSEFIQAYNAKDAKLMQKRAEAFRIGESRLWEDYRKHSYFAYQEAEKFALLALLAPSVGLFLFMLTVRRKIFKPIERLSRRMMDFLVDRYSFQFSTPEANELGELQQTFNSLAQRVINTMDELKHLDQAKTEFLSIASHELRTPMTSIKGSLSLLVTGVMGTVEPGCMRLLKIAEIETDRLIRLINDLLDLAKIEAGRLPLACTWASWDAEVAKSIEGLVGLAHNSRVHVVADAAAGLELFIDCDRFQQVLTNLISNAIKFSPSDGVVRVTVGRGQDGEAIVNVSDQGPGIAAEDRALIFQKFRQAKSPENPVVKGTGLGLTIAKALVEEHGGEIGVESEPGNGSVFWFTLPKWRDDENGNETLPNRRAA
jgi:signal transduction histidine kinase